MLNSRFCYSRAKYWLYSEFEYYSNNILFVFVFGHNSEPEYYSYSYSAKYLCTNIIRIRIRSFWKKRILFVFVFGQNSDAEYYSYSYSVKKTVFAHLWTKCKFSYQCQYQHDKLLLLLVSSTTKGTSVKSKQHQAQTIGQGDDLKC